MKFYLDSANIEEIERTKKLGLLDGITTNPSLIAKEVARTGKTTLDIIKIIADFQVPVSVEVMKGLTYASMVEEGLKLSKIKDNIIVKIPITEDGIIAISQLYKFQVKTNATLCFSPLQALLAARAGASYVSPFVGRLDDIAYDGMSLIQDIRLIFVNYALSQETEIIVASIRNPIHILNAARLGADIVTVPFNVIKDLLKHPKTEEGIKIFNQAIDQINSSGLNGYV